MDFISRPVYREGLAKSGREVGAVNIGSVSVQVRPIMGCLQSTRVLQSVKQRNHLDRYSQLHLSSTACITVDSGHHITVYFCFVFHLFYPAIEQIDGLVQDCSNSSAVLH